MIRLLPLAAFFLLLLSQPAEAAPVAAVFAALGTAFKAAITIKAIAVAALKTLITTGVSVLLQKLNKGSQRDPGLVTTHTTSGGTDPQATIVGRYASGGHVVYQNAHGGNNIYNTHVVEFGDLPGASLRRVIIDGEFSDLGTEWVPGLGYKILSKVNGANAYAWVRFHDGTQTAADPDLVDLYSGDGERPWTDSHILTGVCYAVFTFYRSDSMFPNGRPDYQLELDGPGFYDPRQDSTVGGSGPQRFDTPATWTQTSNLLVIAYNILRGVRLPCGRVYGGGFEAEDLPLPDWFAALNACDLLVGDDNRPQFRGGYEIKFEEIPADILKEIFSACNAQVVEVGGYWYPLVGDSGPAVVEISLEDDLLVSEAWQHSPFPGVESTFNAISTSLPSPEALWNATTLETITRDEWVTEDGGTKLFDLSLPMVWDTSQARQIANALLKENRQFRTHKWPMLPEHFHLRPLKTIKANSSGYGYEAKAFRITEMAYNLQTLTSVVSVREADPADYDPDLDLELPEAPRPTGLITPVDAGVPGLAVTAAARKDGASNYRAPVIRINWIGSLADTTSALAFQAKVTGNEEKITASTSDVASGEFVLEPVLRATDYLVRAKPIAASRVTDWSLWLPVTTLDIGLSPADLSDETFDALADDAYDIASALNDDLIEGRLDPIDAEQAAQAAAQGDAELATLALTVKGHGDREEQRQAQSLASEDLHARVTEEGLVTAQKLTRLDSQLADTGKGLIGHAAALETLDTAVQEVDGRVSAQASAFLGLQTTVGQNTASIAQTLETVDGISAEYTLRIEANGVVSGMVLRSDLDDAGQPTSQVAFQTDKFAVVSPDGSTREVPFVVYASPRTIAGKLYPAGVYMENVFLGRAAIGRAQIEDSIQSDDYAEDANGTPTAGLKLDFETGQIKAAGVLFSRPMVLARGSFSLSGTFDDGDAWSFVNTGIRVGKADVWQASSVALVAVASVSSAATAPGGIDPNNSFWTLNASVQPGGRWNGFNGNPQPGPVWQKDPSTLITPRWASASDQRVFLKIEMETTGGLYFNNPTIEWTVFQVT
ncbi:DUF1983 domain-containing protein [Phaeobacter sp. 11ANDIMAR09]|uniref:phage tail tip fiber protein n=1 Tax=Phaeobacter sp. 11ANDIMAR09 TaxID=1225647 RepID=UPI0006C87CE4|nr:DUF1983 domain-containing protein [Phaeobacter sp. 11ANDIMAR09]